jgi:hypothetical protein
MILVKMAVNKAFYSPIPKFRFCLHARGTAASLNVTHPARFGCRSALYRDECIID